MFRALDLEPLPQKMWGSFQSLVGSDWNVKSSIVEKLHLSIPRRNSSPKSQSSLSAYADPDTHFKFITTFTPWKESYDQSRKHIKKQRHYFANKGPFSQGYGFSSGHVWMWELDCEESLAPKNRCFWTVVLEKTLESPLDCKIQPVHPKGDQSWVFIGRTDVEAETPIRWPPDGKSWLIWKDPDFSKDWRQEEKETTEDEMVGWHHRLNGHEFG